MISWLLFGLLNLRLLIGTYLPSSAKRVDVFSEVPPLVYLKIAQRDPATSQLKLQSALDSRVALQLLLGEVL